MFHSQFILLSIIFLVSLTRLVPHLPNFTPILALALFGGAYLPSKITAFLIPISAMFLSDLILGFHSQVYSVYGCILILSFLGFVCVRKKSKIVNHGGNFQVRPK